ncbi:MAG: hypothetical protein NVSMB22_25260 [Chloroflexota bacterium]
MTVGARSVRAVSSRTVPGQNKNWWVEPVAVAIGFSLFVIYSTWSVFNWGGGHGWERGPYLSPFFSPLLKLGWFPYSSAILVAWMPLGFRGTCYYYRKAYYRAFFWDPPACAINEAPHRKYGGEKRLPWILNNLHRFFLYLALVILTILWFDAIRAFYYNNSLYVGVGSVLMLTNVVFITMYTFSCHALRHLVGGSVDCFSCVRGGGARRGLWGLVSRINPYHGTFAWFSLVSVAAVDLYIRFVSSGALGSCFGAHTGC